jgi:ABC-type ATPase with predicted acetyltransferase domain
VSKEFPTHTEPTQRVIEVADAFGLGLDEEKRFIVVNELVVDVNPGDVVYVTGESGSGKSTLLRELADMIEASGEFGRVLRDWELKIDPEGVVVESVGRSTEEALEILSYAGLNEAFIFTRRFHELSDGQKYRFKLAKLIDSGVDVWVLDEFCSLLDRVTAKVVAYCIQKAARRFGKTLLVATAHDDLLYDLNPNIHIVKKLGPDAVVNTYTPEPHECSLLRDAVIREAGRDTYKRLAHFHYRGGLPNTTQKVYAAYIHGELAGVIAYTTPHFNLAARNKALPWLKKMNNRERLEFINRNITRIARVIVAPKFRGIGLGVKVVKETMPLTGKKYVETLAVMARYNPFFEKAGMRRVEYQADPEYAKALQRLEALGFNIELLGSKRHNLSIIEKLTRKQLVEVQKILLAHFFSPKFRSNAQLIEKVKELDKEALAKALTNRRLKPVYLIWENPLKP